MKFGTLLCAALIPATFGCNPLRSLAQVCQSARIEIHDPAAWATYLAAVTAVDLETQRSIARGRLAGQIKAPPDLQAFIQPFPYVAGYEKVEQNAVQPGSGDVPRPSVTRVTRDGRPIATVHDFGVEVGHFGYTDFATCSRDYPEVFGLRRTVVDKY